MSYTINSNIKAKYYGGSRATSQIKYLVYHYTANSGTTATAKGNANYFNSCPRKASAHYVVDEKETIYQCVPDTYIAYSVGDNNGGGPYKGKCTNTNSISIEMVSHSSVKSPEVGKGQYYIPDTTMTRAIELGVAIMKKYGIDIDHVLRHEDVTGKICPEPMSKRYSYGVTAWTNFKAKLKAAYNGTSTSTTTTVKEDDEVVTDRKVNLFGKETTTKGILKDGSNYLSCDIIKQMNLNVSSNGSEPVITMPNVKVKVNGQVKEVPGFNANGTNVVSIRSIAELLGKTVGWDSTSKTITIE